MESEKKYMKVRRLFESNHIWVAAAVLFVVFGSVHFAEATCSTGGGVTCCGRVYGSLGACCWSIACSDGTVDGGCTSCVLARLGKGVQKQGTPKDRIEKDPTVLLTQLLVQDRDLSRALRLIR